MRLWDVQIGEKIYQIVDGKPVNDAIFSPNGSYILTAGEGGVRLRDAKTGEELRRFGSIVEVYRAAFSPDGNFVLTSWSYTDGTARLWETSTGKMLREYPTAPGDTGCVDFFTSREVYCYCQS